MNIGILVATGSLVVLVVVLAATAIGQSRIEP